MLCVISTQLWLRDFVFLDDLGNDRRIGWHVNRTSSTLGQPLFLDHGQGRGGAKDIKLYPLFKHAIYCCYIL
jgi:hypothetical protein